jgi:hypothetical protein
MANRDPDLPIDPAEYRPRPLMGVGFWALIALCVLCVLAGAGVAVLGPKLWPRRPPAPAAASAPHAVAAPAAPAATAPAQGDPATADQLARLNARIASLETQGARSSEAAAAALAAAALVDGAQGSRPFADQLAALRAAAPGLPEITALSRLSETGAPSRAALAASFPEAAAAAARKARKPGEHATLGERIVYAASKVVTVRRIEVTAGDAPDAVLARAQVELDEGDVVRALRTLDRLPPAARAAMADWRAQAERRAEIDRAVGALRARAMRDLQDPAA